MSDEKRGPFVFATSSPSPTTTPNTTTNNPQLAALEARIHTQLHRSRAGGSAAAGSGSGSGSGVASGPTVPPTQFQTISDPSHGLAALDQHDRQMRRMHAHAAHNPIIGLATSQRHGQSALRSQIASIREKQQQLFLAQFAQFPEMPPQHSGSSSSDSPYNKIWSTFKSKDHEQEQLVQQLDGLCGEIDQLHKMCAPK